MRAVRFYEYGGPEVLRLEEVPRPDPAEDEVLLRVYATSVRSGDVLQRVGGTPVFGVSLPFQLGRESSGIVAGVGRRVEGWREGDEAITRSITPCGACDNCRNDLPECCRQPRYQGASAWGGYADYVCVPARSLMPKPASVDHDQAAGFQGGTLTAWHNLVGRAHLRPEETVLIPSASGAVASGGVAVARHLGARVIATTGGRDKAARVARLGADVVIDYTTEDLLERTRELTGDRGVDLLFDTVGGDGFEQRVAALRSGGRIVMPGAADESRLAFSVNSLIQKQATLIFAKGSRPDEAATVLDLMAAGKLQVAIGQVFPLEEAAEAHRCLEGRRHVGRVILDVAGRGYQPNI